MKFSQKWPNYSFEVEFEGKFGKGEMVTVTITSGMENYLFAMPAYAMRNLADFVDHSLKLNDETS